MAPRKTKEVEITPPTVTPEMGIELLRRLVDEGDKLLNNRPITSITKKLWENKAKEYFARAFGSDPRNINVVLNAGTRSFNLGQSDAYYENLRFEELKDKIYAVSSMIELLQLEIDLNTSCPKCGQKYPKGMHNFCLHCGTPLNNLNDGVTEESGAGEALTIELSQPNTLVRQDGSYWEVDSSGEIVGDPYCSRCLEVDGKHVHLDAWEGMLTCPQCASTIS